MDPRAEIAGDWDQDEIAVFPRDLALHSGLEDDQRAVLLEWVDLDPPRAGTEAGLLVDLVNAQIARLHG